MKTLLIIISLHLVLYSCNSTISEELHFEISDTNNIITGANTISPQIDLIDTLFNRTAIIERLNLKKANKQPLIVHVYVPLCDNEHQGIVPTTASLGDGMNIKSNLYWATSGGTKAYFKKQQDWKLVLETLDIDTNVLERVVFEKMYSTGKVYLIADAYRGDRMEETVNDYLAAISGNRPQHIILTNDTIQVAEAADLIMFNGHNGMMDNIQLKPWVNKTKKRTDVVMNSCVSFGYLQDEFMLAGGYPLVRSNSLLYPGAYVLAQIIDDWVEGVEEDQICLNAGATYCKKHNCGEGTLVYSSGW